MREAPGYSSQGHYVRKAAGLNSWLVECDVINRRHLKKDGRECSDNIRTPSEADRDDRL